jgi:acetylglutamate kinase
VTIMIASVKFKSEPVVALATLAAPDQVIPANVMSAQDLPTHVMSAQDMPLSSLVSIDIARLKDEMKKERAHDVVIVKFGGNAIGNEAVLEGLIDDAVAMIKAGIHVVVVHGGGTAVNDALAAIGKETKKLNGLRVTDEETLAIAVKVFGEINNKLTEKFRQKGVSALGFCSQSTLPFQTEKMSEELGFVGEIVDVHSGNIESWMWAGWIPVVSPLGVDGGGQFYNINADHAALALATNLEADGLIFMTDVPGVLKDFKEPKSRIGHVTLASAEALIADGTVSGGMLPKIKSCVKGVQNGIKRIAIINSFEPNALMRGFVKPEEIGTLITGEKNDQ